MAGHDHWLTDYQSLLLESGLDQDELADRARLPAALPAGPSLGQCLADPWRFRAGFGNGLDEQGLRVRASVLHQALALTILAPVATRFLLTGEAHLPDDDSIWLAPDPSHDPMPWHAERSQPRATLQDPDEFFSVMAARSRAWYPVFRGALGVSPGAYWSSMGLGFCAPLTAMYDRLEPARLCDQATRWLAEFDCDARRYIDWMPARFGDNTCAIPQRRGCCLKFKLPDGGYCGTCGIYRRERLRALELGQIPEL